MQLLLLYLAVAADVEEQEEQAHKVSLEIAVLERQRLTIRTRNKLRCINLKQPEESTWHTLYASGYILSGREGFVNVTGFDIPSFKAFF